jgi:hypothetical protein
MKLTGENRSTRGNTSPSVTLSTTNPTWTDPGSNPGLRGGRPASNRLSHRTPMLSRLPFQVFMCLSSGMLRGMGWSLITDFSGHNGSIFS